MTSREQVTRRWLAAVAAAVALTTAACDDDDGPPGVEARPVLDVRPSADEPVCLQVAETEDAIVEELPTIDCSEPHSHEVFATAESDEDVFPGMEALERFAEAQCLTAFEGFVGTSAFDSALSFTWLVPTLESWTEDDDREVLCVLMNGDGSPLIGSMQDAQV